MNTTRRQLCFLGSAVCAAPFLDLSVEKLFETTALSIDSASDQKDSSFASKELITLVIGVSHEIAAQLTLVDGWTELAQEKLNGADFVTIKAHLEAAQKAAQRASDVLNLMRNEIRTKHLPRARRSRPLVLAAKG